MTLNIDRVFGEIGDFGPGQKGYAAALCLFNCYGAWHMMAYAFVAFKIGFECQAKDQDSPNYNECPAGQIQNCETLVFNTQDGQNTIISEWSLVCDQVRRKNIWPLIPVLWALNLKHLIPVFMRNDFVSKLLPLKKILFHP